MLKTTLPTNQLKDQRPKYTDGRLDRKAKGSEARRTHFTHKKWQTSRVGGLAGADEAKSPAKITLIPQTDLGN